MKTCAIITALAAVALAAPAKRDLVWVTKTEVATVYVDTTETVWVTGGATQTSTASPSTSAAAPATVQQKNKQLAQSSTTTPIVQPETTSSSTPSVYIAPTTAAPSTTAPAPTTTPVAPTSTTPLSTYVAPSPTPYSAPTSASSSAAAPAYSSPASSGGSSGCDAYSPGASCSGAEFSYYTAGMGACGIESTDSDPIFAFPLAAFEALTPNGNPNNNPMCGKKIAITAYDGTKITATLVDSCPGCDAGHLDLTPSLWDAVSKGDPNADGLAHDYTYVWL